MFGQTFHDLSDYFAKSVFEYVEDKFFWTKFIVIMLKTRYFGFWLAQNDQIFCLNAAETFFYLAQKI